MPGPPSSIDLLPKSVREALHGWLNDPGITQAEAAGRVNAMLAEVAPEYPGVSRRAVNRYDQRYREVTRQLRESREVSARMVAELGSKPGGEMGHLLTEMIRVLSFYVTAAMKEEARREMETAEAERDSARERLRKAEERLARSKLAAARDKAQSDFERAESAHKAAAGRYGALPEPPAASSIVPACAEG